MSILEVCFCFYFQCCDRRAKFSCWLILVPDILSENDPSLLYSVAMEHSVKVSFHFRFNFLIHESDENINICTLNEEDTKGIVRINEAFVRTNLIRNSCSA